MDRIFISSDYHLWNKKNDDQHPARSQNTLNALKTHLSEGMTSDDCWIYLGDLCDPEVADEKYLRELIASVPARRVMCRGNNDTASSNWYYNLGFDDVVDVVRVHNILFSHKPIRVAPDELNIHGHLHGEIWSELGYKYITVYDDNLAEHHPVTLDDILRDAAPPLTRNPDYSMWEKDSTSPLYAAVDGGTKADSILDLSKEFVLIPVDEAALPDSKIPYGTSGGWYNTEPGREGVWEPKATIGKKTYREVANILIVKNLAKNPLVYVVPKSNGEYSIPGGGTNPKETMAQSAMREAEEEAHIVTKNVNYYGQFILTPKELGWSGPMHYTGGKSVHVFAGEYDRPYRGKVAEVDQDDSVLNNGRWVPVKDAMKHLHPKYAEALADYCGITKIESSSDIVDEACKNVAEARKFVAEVGKLAGKYDANYFVVTDGASGIHNSGNPAVKAARDAHVKWELANGGNPDEDWSTWISETADTIIDEVIFPDIDSTRYFESDDEYHKRKAEKAEKEDSSVVAVEESVLFDSQLTRPLCELNESIRQLSIDLAEASQEMSYSSSQEVVNGVPVKDKESLTVKNGRKKPLKIVKDNLQESTFADVKMIIGTLSGDERKLLYHGGAFVDSPNVIYREVSHTDKPGSTGGFVEVYKFNDDPSTGIMVLAVSPHDRGTGLSDNLIANSISPLSGMGVKRIFCRVVNGNTHSMDMLERNEFAKLASDDHYTKYVRDIEHLTESANPNEWGTTREYAYEKFKNLSSQVDESSLPIPIYKLLHPEAGKTVELFHGTNVRYKTLEPVAMDFGNQFTKAGWSVFMWDNYDMAKRWALFVTCRELRIGGAGPKGHIRFMKTSVNDAHLLVSPEDLAEFKAYMAHNVVNMYVFHAHIPIDEINIGNDSTHDEFTVRRSVKPDKVDTIRITPKMLDDYCEVMPEERIERIRKLNKKNMRGIVSPLLNHDYYWVKANHEDLIDRLNGDIRTGKLQPGVDLEQYFEDNDIVIPSVPLKDRMYRFKPLDLESVKVNESASGNNKILGDIIKLNKKLNGMQYGLLRPGQSKIPPVELRDYNTTSEDYCNLWKMASPAQFIRQDGGVCWDYVTYEADYFNHHFKGVPFKTYYIEFNDGDDMPSHTFLTFELDGKHYWFESSFKKVRGIWEAQSEDDLISAVMLQMDRHDTEHGHTTVLSSFPYEIYTYNAADKRLYGIGCEAFMDWVRKHGTPYRGDVDIKRGTNARLITATGTLTEAVVDDFAKYKSDHHNKTHKSLSQFEKKLMNSDDIKRHCNESEMVDGCLPTNHKTKNYAIGWFEKYGSPEEELVAMVRVCQYHKNGETYYGISRLYVSPNYRGMDLGSQALKTAQEMGGTRLYVRSDNRVAKEMYERRGFREYYRSKDNKYIGMRCDLGKGELSETASKKKSSSSKFSMDGQGSGHSNPLDDREKRESIADKYGLRDVGNTHEEDEYEETDIERRRKERMRNLRKANRVRRWNRIKRKIKRFFTGKNEAVTDVDDDGTWIDHSHEEEDYLVGLKEPFFEHPDRYKDADTNLEGAIIAMDDTIIFNDRINEAAASSKLKPVYVVLIHSGTKLATTIKALTGAQYTHASISFDPSLEHMYSFGAFEDKSHGRFANGFQMENFRSPWFQSRDISYAIYMVPCTESEYEMMERRLSYFIRNDTKFRFNKLGLLKNFLGIFDNPQYRFFCSQFVADILHAGRPDSDFLENPGKLRPIDFTKFEDAIYIGGGDDMRLYDSNIVVEKTTKLLRAAEMKRKIYNEGVIMDINEYNPWASEVLDYQLRAMSESESSDFMAYVTSLKTRDGADGKTAFGPHDIDVAWAHYIKVKKQIEEAEKIGNISEVKNNLRKLDAIMAVLDRYAMGNTSDHNLTTSTLRVRNAVMNTLRVYIRQVKAMEPDYNHRLFCGSGSYDRSDFPERMLYPAGDVTIIDC